MSKLSAYAEACNGVNDREIWGDVQAERREEAQNGGQIGSLNLPTINPAVFWVVPSNGFLLLRPVSCVFMSGSKTVVFEPML
jgi:hypothetical protein